MGVLIRLEIILTPHFSDRDNYRIGISSHDNLVGYDQKPHLTSVSGRISSCPIPEHYIKSFKTSFEAFGQFLTKLSQPLSSTQNQGPKQRIKA